MKIEKKAFITFWLFGLLAIIGLWISPLIPGKFNDAIDITTFVFGLLSFTGLMVYIPLSISKDNDLHY